MRQYTAIRPRFKSDSPHGGGSKSASICRTTLAYVVFAQAPRDMPVPTNDHVFNYSRPPGAHTAFQGRLSGEHQPSGRGYTT